MTASNDIFRGIVVGLELDPRGRELSHGSEAALRKVELLAGHFRVPVTLVHSTAADEIWDPEQSGYIRRPVLGDAGRQALEDAARRLGSVASGCRLEISDEHAVVAILGRVEATGADLVVVARRSMPVGDGRSLGSVARTLIQRCPCAVWVVRATSHPGGCILAGADLSSMGERVVRAAAALAPVLEAELHVAHALGLPLEIQMESEAGQQAWLERSTREAETQILAWLEGAPAKTHIGVTSPTQALLEGAEKLRPRLVVMGSVARSGLPRFVLGNTAVRLLDRLEPSLLVVKPQ